MGSYHSTVICLGYETDSSPARKHPLCLSGSYLYNELLKTMQDAVRVTCALDMPDIWIDALCIMKADYMGGIHTCILDTQPSLHGHGAEPFDTRGWTWQ
jgi:hypothetical protein